MFRHSACMSSSYKESSMQVQLNLAEATASTSWTSASMSSNSPALLSSITLSPDCFSSCCIHVPCRDMNNDRLLLTSAEQQIAQTRAGFAWINHKCQDDIYAGCAPLQVVHRIRPELGQKIITDLFFFSSFFFFMFNASDGHIMHCKLFPIYR